MEEILQEDRGIKTFTEVNLGAFCDDPSSMTTIFYENVVIMGLRLEEMGRKPIVREMERIRSDVDAIEIEKIEFVKFDFMRGFHQQLAWGKIVVRIF